MTGGRPARRLRIAVDAAGGDGGPGPVVEAAVATADEFDIVLVGPRGAIEAELGRRPGTPALSIVDADQVVGMAEDPVAATWAKRRSSLLAAADAVATGRADAMVTAGNTGAAVLAATARLRRVPGVRNPALATLLPAPGAGPTVLLDLGATTACAPEWLVQFAVLGAEYARVRLGLPRPRIGLLSNGHEEVKGGPVQKDAHVLLATTPGYIGQIEAYHLLSDQVDVAVTDGFTGDVALKMYERTLDATADVAVDAARRLGNESGDDGDRLARGVTAAIRAALAAEAGGVLLGVRGVCVICHGAAAARDVADSIRVAARCVERGVVPAVEAAFANQWRQPRRPARVAAGRPATAAASSAYPAVN